MNKDAISAVHFQKSIEYHNLRHYEAALAEINLALGLKKESGEFFFQKGLILEQLQRYEEALSAYIYAIMYDPKNEQKYEQYKKKMELLAPEMKLAKVVTSTYLGGHSAFLGAKDVRLQMLGSLLIIPEMELKIPYGKITRIQSQTTEQLIESRMIMLEKLSFKLREKQVYMVISYIDEMQMEQNLVLDGNIDTLMPMIYNRAITAKTKSEY
jgi:tetratricopeptide (TPR) repeat protein